MARVPLADLDPSDPAMETIRTYFTGREMPEIYRTLANAPRLLRAWTDLAWPLRNEVLVPRGLREPSPASRRGGLLRSSSRSR
jgi:hypothetical protein